MAKKAYTAAYTLVIVVSIIVLIIPTYLFVLTLIDKYTDLISTHNIENYILAYRIFYSKNSILYADKITDRAYTNIIDSGRFNEQVINDLLGKIGQDVGIGVILEYNNLKKEIYVNKESYLAGISRQDIYDITFFKRIVFVIDNPQKYTGTLTLGIAFKKK